MTLKELLDHLEIIHRERMLSAHHDDMFFQTYSDVEALERVIAMVKFLVDKNPAANVKVAELLTICNIDE